MSTLRELRPDEVNASGINQVLREIQLRLQALERRAYVTVQMLTDAEGIMSPITLAPPPWPVKAVLMARARDATNNIPFTPGRIGWEITNAGITVALWVGDVSPSTKYEITLELHG